MILQVDNKRCWAFQPRGGTATGASGAFLLVVFGLEAACMSTPAGVVPFKKGVAHGFLISQSLASSRLTVEIKLCVSYRS